jgi:hypothetical protein
MHKKQKTPAFRCGPATNHASEIYADHLGCFEFPRDICHDVNGVCTTHTACNHPQTARIRGMRVSTNHKTTGKRVVLENDLVDDTRTRSPEAKAILVDSIVSQGKKEGKCYLPLQ